MAFQIWQTIKITVSFLACKHGESKHDILNNNYISNGQIILHNIHNDKIGKTTK